MTSTRRARNSDDKASRRLAILAVASNLLDSSGYEAFTMDRLAKATGLAKGTLYLYFETREQLFLTMLEAESRDWSTDLDAALAAGLESATRAWDASHTAKVIWESLASRPCLVRLISMLEGVLEHNVPAESVLAFRQSFLGRLRITGALLERRLPWLQRGEGITLLRRIRALLTGLQQMSDSPPVVRRVLEENPDLNVFRIDLAVEFLATVTALMQGWRAERTGPAWAAIRY